ncbi:GntR family transcriptional regulator, partial [Bacillus anthracis]
MQITITNTSKEPIYEQISAQIKKLILLGDLKQGDALPSMRQLAKDLRVSIITTKRAYEELEKDGFINSIV